MEYKEMTRDEVIDIILEQLAIHFDGDEQNAHALATEMSAGFASPEMVSQARGHLLKDNELGFRYPDILDVPCGMYATTAQWGKQNPPNTDPGSIMQLFVYAEHAQRKILVAITGYNGEIFVWHTHNNNSYNSPGWRKMTTAFTLFEGSSAGVDTLINLNDSMKHYSTLKIHVAGWGGQVYEANNVLAPTISFCNTYDSSAGMEMYELKLERVTDTQYKIVRSNQQYVMGTVSGVQFKDNVKIKITKIEGLK
ncbi:hypothetical protein [Enterococcus thailandicus]|uniref:hypothetical protein n=1 Tax=Enterococcus thailandicus TaxID=417368 RepID=UPI0022E7E3E3|nr:hypothetical protein [Enterococcus thailandicus]